MTIKLSDVFPAAKLTPPSFQGYVEVDCGEERPYVYPLDSNGLAAVQGALKNPDVFSRFLSLSGRAVTFMPSRCRAIRLWNDSARGLARLAEQGEDETLGYFGALLALLAIGFDDEEKVAKAVPEVAECLPMAHALLMRSDCRLKAFSEKIMIARIVRDDGDVLEPVLSGRLESALETIDAAAPKGMFVLRENGVHETILAIPAARVAVLDLPQIMIDDYAELIRRIEAE